jgi:hypothetical protein
MGGRFDLGEGPQRKCWKRLKAEWPGQALEEISSFSELRRSSEGHSKAVLGMGKSR